MIRAYLNIYDISGSYIVGPIDAGTAREEPEGSCEDLRIDRARAIDSVR
jgi:hypothetical protein